METVIRYYLRRKGQQKEGKENYWGFPNILPKAEPILDSFLGVGEMLLRGYTNAYYGSNILWASLQTTS